MGDKFDVGYKLLPPELQVRLWVLALDANTSKVNLAYNPGNFRTSVTYNYGGNLEASLGVRRYSLNLAFDPSTRDVTLGTGLVFRGFNFGASTNITQGSFGASVSYGRKLLPFPDELSNVFNSANGGLMNMTRDISAAPNNPLAWYKLHSDDVRTIGKAVDAVKDIAAQGKSESRYGFGLRLNYSQPAGIIVYGGLVGSF
jgi:hypothetical protein